MSASPYVGEQRLDGADPPRLWTVVQIVDGLLGVHIQHGNRRHSVTRREWRTWSETDTPGIVGEVPEEGGP